MSTTRKIVHIDEEKCNGCGECVPACAEGALKVIDGVARLVSEAYCDGLGACLGECPQDAITIEEREAEAFDEAAVEQHLAEPEEEAAGCPRGAACPGAALRAFLDADNAPDERPCAESERTGCGKCCGRDAEDGDAPTSKLRHWPVQLMLVPPGAPFLKGADIVVCADCVAFAVPDFHERYVAGHAVLVGCPKLDDLAHYRKKLKEIFAAARPAAVTVLRMEVPCCAGIADAALDACDEALPGQPVEVHTVGIRGGIARSVFAGPSETETLA